MQTVIRLKRTLEDSPSDTLILNCNKKQKLEDANEASGNLSTILKLTGTHNSQDVDINQHIASIKNSSKGGVKEIIIQKYKRNVDINKKLLEQAKEHSKAERYKIVNCLRSISTDEPNSSVTVLDIEKEKEEDGKPESNQNYVYDLYLTEAKILGEVDDYDISIQPTTVTFDSDDVYDNSDPESDDSNAENYYTNEYPDESDVDSIDENDIMASMEKCELRDLSSTDDEYVHYQDAKEHYSDAIDSEDEFGGDRFKKFASKYGSTSRSSESMSDASDDNYYD